MNKVRLDNYLVEKGLVSSRSQAQSYIKLGAVLVDKEVRNKPGFLITDNNEVMLTANKKYVSRAGHKLESVAEVLNLSFSSKAVLDVGSSTGGFTDYALQHGASKIIAVDIGSKQLHPTLRTDKRIELHEQTDIRSFKKMSTKIDIVLIDVSFLSIREVLLPIAKLAPEAKIVAMVKPQFESAKNSKKHKGVIKNKTIRRQILKEFEQWANTKFKILSKADSSVAGEKGNVERFYLLEVLR